MAFVPVALAALGGGSALAGGAMLAATAASAYMASKQQPKAPDAPAVTPPPQPSKVPDRQQLATTQAAMAGMGGSMSGNSSTFLTGPNGIDSTKLNLGRNVLLGQ